MNRAISHILLPEPAPEEKADSTVIPLRKAALAGPNIPLGANKGWNGRLPIG